MFGLAECFVKGTAKFCNRFWLGFPTKYAANTFIGLTYSCILHIKGHHGTNMKVQVTFLQYQEWLLQNRVRTVRTFEELLFLTNFS